MTTADFNFLKSAILPLAAAKNANTNPLAIKNR
jgi:hypothetical protein